MIRPTVYNIKSSSCSSTDSGKRKKKISLDPAMKQILNQSEDQVEEFEKWMLGLIIMTHHPNPNFIYYSCQDYGKAFKDLTNQCLKLEMEKDELMERWNKNGEMRKSENISEKHFRQLHLGMTHRL